MRQKVTIYTPEGNADSLASMLLTSFGQQIEIQTPPSAPLYLEKLKCFSIRIKGSVMHSRAPFVYPLLSGELHPYYLTSAGQLLSDTPGADWVYLGGSHRQFLLLLGQYMLLNNVRRVIVQPFGSIDGELSRVRQPGDKEVIMCKQTCLHNDKLVKGIKDVLLAEPPEHWNPKDYCLVVDRYESIRPLIDKYLTEPPRTIVDIGCGLGNTTNSLAKAFPDAEVTGYDFSQASIDVARHSFKLPNLSYEVGDFTKPFLIQEKSVDLLVSVEATNMSAAPTFTAREFCRVLSDQGLAVNVSLSESGYVYWDYPASLFFPTHMNSFATDWFFTAKAAGFGFRLEPWNLMSFTYLPCRDKAFFNAHRAFMNSRVDSEHYQPYYDRFAMIFGPSVKGLKPSGVNRHMKESSYLDYVAICLESYDPKDVELDRFTKWGIDLVKGQLRLLPEAYEFLSHVLPESRAFRFFEQPMREAL